QGVDWQTGGSLYEYGINQQEYGQIQSYAKRFGLEGMMGSQAMMAGGTSAMGEQIRQIQKGQFEYNFQMQQTQQQMGQQLLTGGATGVNAQGQAVGGNGLAGYQQLAAQQGYQFNVGNGMGIWQIQDAQTSINRQQQAWSLQQNQ